MLRPLPFPSFPHLSSPATKRPPDNQPRGLGKHCKPPPPVWSGANSTQKRIWGYIENRTGQQHFWLILAWNGALWNMWNALRMPSFVSVCRRSFGIAEHDETVPARSRRQNGKHVLTVIVLVRVTELRLLGRKVSQHISQTAIRSREDSAEGIMILQISIHTAACMDNMWMKAHTCPGYSMLNLCIESHVLIGY